MTHPWSRSIRIPTAIALLATFVIAAMTPARATAQSSDAGIFGGGAARADLTWYPRSDAFNAISGVRWNDAGISELIARLGENGRENGRASAADSVPIFGLSGGSVNVPPLTGLTPIVLGNVYLHADDGSIIASAIHAAVLAPGDSVLALIKSGVTLLRVNEDAGMVVRGAQDVGTAPASGAGVRMMWYPGRYAFRAGQVSSAGAAYWDAANVGYGSAAFGDNTRASGDQSFAAGSATTASGAQAVALGSNGTASGERSFAFNGTASGVGAVAIGSGAQATNDDALAMGPSSIAGGLASIVLGPSIANGNFAVAIGLQNSASGQFSVAIGKNARTANRQGSVVLGDGCAGFSSDSVYPTANNQFIARGCGGIKFFTSQNLSAGVQIAAGGGSWSSISDRNRKAHFLAVDGEDVLRRLRTVPVTTWNYKTQDDSIRHMGPMAQDFRAAFALGEDERLINTVDIDGVNMAASQALDARTLAQQARIDTLTAQIAALRTQNDRLQSEQARLARLLDTLLQRVVGRTRIDSTAGPR